MALRGFCIWTLHIHIYMYALNWSKLPAFLPFFFLQFCFSHSILFCFVLFFPFCLSLSKPFLLVKSLSSKRTPYTRAPLISSRIQVMEIRASHSESVLFFTACMCFCLPLSVTLTTSSDLCIIWTACKLLNLIH